MAIWLPGQAIGAQEAPPLASAYLSLQTPQMVLEPPAQA